MKSYHPSNSYNSTWMDFARLQLCCIQKKKHVLHVPLEWRVIPIFSTQIKPSKFWHIVCNIPYDCSCLCLYKMKKTGVDSMHIHTRRDCQYLPVGKRMGHESVGGTRPGVKPLRGTQIALHICIHWSKKKNQHWKSHIDPIPTSIIGYHYHSLSASGQFDTTFILKVCKNSLCKAQFLDDLRFLFPTGLGLTAIGLKLLLYKKTISLICNLQ